MDAEAVVLSQERKSATRYNHNKDWTSTHDISFTISPEAVAELAKLRIQRNRGAQTLTVIDPDSRVRNGPPYFEVVAEMDYHNIQRSLQAAHSSQYAHPPTR
jgi:phosphatidylserine/phosphatidylglycerophosphate/cardiolipin synthase-like enzyme